MSKNFYERNDYVLNHDINKYFEEVLWMTDDEFEQWVRDFRRVIAEVWDTHGNPPRVGWMEDEIVDQFNKLSAFPSHKLLFTDEYTGEENIIRPTSNLGNAANQWFPTMMKTKIVYNKIESAVSIYDHFVREDLFDKVHLYAKRHFKRDSFYNHGLPVRVNNKVEVNGQVHLTTTGTEFIKWFENNIRDYDTHDYWLKPDKDVDYSGYRTDIQEDKVDWIRLSREEIADLNIPDKCKVNMVDEYDIYQVILFKKKQKVFPAGFKAFRVSWCQYAVNFPPLVAKFLYERYTNHIKDQDRINIFDPSSGWGGRILGAMSVRDDRNIHYIGTDPNTDHNCLDSDGHRTTKYEELAKFFNTKTYRAYGLEPHTNTYDVYQLGSEVIGDDPEFKKKYEKDLDLVFTSPPYFAKEAYSEDETQSYKKFGEYMVWVEGFLRPTLENAVKNLKSDRYLLWNIADAKFGSEMLPLEEDSRKILEELGMEYVETMKLALAQMPGGNRIDKDTGLPNVKNFCKVNNLWLKYEPIFVYRKP